jgi:hypothetical protein
MRCLIIVCFLYCQVCFPQPYKNTVGLRGGVTSGITLRHHLDEGQSFEGIFSFPDNGIKFTGLKETSRPCFTDYFNNIHFIKGYGGHIGVINTDRYTMFGTSYHYNERLIGPVIGIDGYFGMEYQFISFPLSIGLDYKPFLEFSTIQFFDINPWDLAFTIKYSFK